MKILIVSDSHDNYEKLKKAISFGNDSACGVMLHAGDFVSPPGIKLLGDFDGSVHIVWGNNEGDKISLVNKIAEYSNVTIHGDIMEETFDGLDFYMNHYPSIVENAALSHKYDVCIFGHTHIYSQKTIQDKVLLLNPGEVHGYKTGTHTAIIFDTKTKIAEKIIL